MKSTKQNPGGLAGSHGAVIALLGDHADDTCIRRPQQLRLATRRTIDLRLIWFRLEHADGLALEVRAKPYTTDDEMDHALAGAMAIFSGERL